MDVLSIEYLNWVEQATSKKDSISDTFEDEFTLFIKELFFKIRNYYIENYIFSIEPSFDIFTFKYNDKCYIISKYYDKEKEKNIYSIKLMHTIGDIKDFISIENIINNKVPYEQIELRNRMNMIKNCVDQLYDMGVPLRKIYGETYSYILSLKKNNK